ncbi:hypothetical protein IGI04_030400 [Brassica rapa subsp. trilocularis]|uniref:Uncharacterized protein n=1 Tax=Brassica rapa subsp. trilocularis TaxID=1813537 RepID=A0ABQ7LTX6_BRACM|nr:hypothetical protein IGI04_030400 [Brassica rapa subsp. trilocularis]
MVFKLGMGTERINNSPQSRPSTFVSILTNTVLSTNEKGIQLRNVELFSETKTKTRKTVKIRKGGSTSNPKRKEKRTEHDIPNLVPNKPKVKSQSEQTACITITVTVQNPGDPDKTPVHRSSKLEVEQRFDLATQT